MTKQTVEITIHETKLLFENCEYPNPTREQIADKLKETIFSYSEKRMNGDINPYTARFEEQRNYNSASSSEYGVYSLDTDPLNEP